MIKNITVQRVDVSSVINDPIQWSENSQLAINNGNQLTILDPKLPLIHQSISTINEIDILDSKGLFNTNTILRSEVFDTLPIRKFNNVTIESLDEPFSFSNINDPSIICHYWSPVNPFTKDCYLGVLFNTAELLILERTNNELNSYSVKFNMFNQLTKDLNINQVSENNELLVNREQFLSLRIRSFEFTQIKTNFESRLLLSLISDNGILSIYQMENDNLIKLAVIETNECIVKQSWSNWSKEGYQKFSSYITLITSKNSIILYKLIFDTNSFEFMFTEPLKLTNNSRFLISQVKWIELEDKCILIVASTNSLKIFVINDITNIQQSKHRLLNCNKIAGIIENFNDVQNTLEVNLSYENGAFELYKFHLNSTSIEQAKPNENLTKFVLKSLYKFQLANSNQEVESSTEAIKEEDQDEKEEDIISSIPQVVKQSTELTRPFLNQVVEGNFINYGIKLNSNGILSIVYKIIPKNVLNYTILSKNEISIGFISIKEIYNNFKSLNNPNTTSLSYINELWFNNYKLIPTFPRLISDNKQEEVNKFVDELIKFKHDFFISLDNLNLTIYNLKEESFQIYLQSNFNSNYNIKNLQILFNFNIILLNSLRILVQYNSENVRNLIDTISNEQQKIENLILIYLIKVIINFISGKEIFNEFDKFLIINYYLFLQKFESISINNSNIPSNSEISIQTKFFKESFKISINDIIDDQVDFKLITSTTNHKWSRCKLTFLPLLEINNKIDELNLFNYIIYDYEEGKDTLINQLLQTINYCIITGNKLYSVR